MKIDRTNYEIWLLDWLDNSLSISRKEELELFLRENPDLNHEFNELSQLSLNPARTSFPFKDKMKKAGPELSQTQFELLCAASLEKDLDPDQHSELMEIIAGDTERKKTFELINRTRLVPPLLSFKNKKILLRRTASQKIIRLSFISLSAAAVLAIIVLTGLFRQSFQPDQFNNVSQNIRAESVEVPVTVESSADGEVPVRAQGEGSLAAGAEEVTDEESETEKPGTAIPDKAIEEPGKTPVIIEKIAFNIQPLLVEKPGNDLIEIAIIPEWVITDDERSRIGKFIAHTFREKILKDEEPADVPLKGYEIAEAGINGLNKLLGWEMALSRNNDENGELRSLYFSSRILKFNAPVKNIETGE